ncbi:aminotransferase-like domain-containing protein [Streptomyces halobius]|uniref:PLP-dependent aminotransferase family protein n=1 Tax=Streptomyces halobius TaxID=2879846 RepID=A0ABY4MAP0_9ACTN|nr:PLP-dependent aminotransferase family protein [Streptomyces halobius]UQA93475.1 PLP-dependent aminotransferase family protein [Streptomyces halobius]
MDNPRATFGRDLHLDLTGPGGVRAALMRALREAVRTGRLAPGTRLPSSRSLAADLGIARNTVADAYAELVAEGWLSARQGSGTRVAERTLARATPPARRAPGRAHRPDRPRYDLTPGTPDVSSFPRTAWLAAARRALTAAPSEAFGYGDPAGRPELRTVLADYLARARGVRADPDRIVVCTGFMQGLGLLSRALRGDDGGPAGRSATPRGRTTPRPRRHHEDWRHDTDWGLSGDNWRQGDGQLAVESYGLSFHRNVIVRAGLRTIPLPVDEHGARTAELAAVDDVRAALLTPAHQFPTGVPLHPDRRAAAVNWARATGGYILEDDYDGELRYDRQPVGALQGLDPDHVVYMGTASKSLAPALRLAWMVLPDRLVDRVLAVKRTGEWASGSLDQLTLAEFLSSGAYDRHLRGMRLRYRRRRDQLVSVLAARAPPRPHLRHRGRPARRPRTPAGHRTVHRPGRPPAGPGRRGPDHVHRPGGQRGPS